MPLNERDRIEILMMIGVGDRMRTQQEVCRLFHEMHPDREPVSQSTVSRIERKYRELGHVRDAPRQGRPKINENVQQDVILSALENPHCTVRQVSRDLNIGKSSVKYHPYRVRLIHELAEDDFDRRTEFCEYMMDHNNQNNGFIANILFSDEATFFLNGHVNRQNTRYWSQENLHWMQEYHTQHPQKVNVWAGIPEVSISTVGEKKLVTKFLETGSVLDIKKSKKLLNEDYAASVLELHSVREAPKLSLRKRAIETEIKNLNRNTYLGMLQNFLTDKLDELPLSYRTRIFFQQDGCPAHHAVTVRNWLNSEFNEHWIGRDGPILWPPRSPDLTILDFYLWGCLKQIVYREPLENDEEQLKTMIQNAVKSLSMEEIRNSFNESRARIEICAEKGGALFE
ncbi:hypothetical protein NQ318_001708 [Aromia moschata]|uniref:Transposase n=1 Tax=Aromia moschata TaxID=1265417 RepID=A0AAV8XWX8_9CUCU|nr:hypothetical protein NQ318_001708 [Aromia moschata]